MSFQLSSDAIKMIERVKNPRNKFKSTLIRLRKENFVAVFLPSFIGNSRKEKPWRELLHLFPNPGQLFIIRQKRWSKKIGSLILTCVLMPMECIRGDALYNTTPETDRYMWQRYNHRSWIWPWDLLPCWIFYLHPRGAYKKLKSSVSSELTAQSKQKKRNRATQPFKRSNDSKTSGIERRVYFLFGLFQPCGEKERETFIYPPTVKKIARLIHRCNNNKKQCP